MYRRYQQSNQMVKKLLFISFIILSVSNLSAQKSKVSSIYEIVIEHSLKNNPKKLRKSKGVAILDSAVTMANHNWLISEYDYLLFSRPKEFEKEIKTLFSNLIADTSISKINIDSISLPLMNQLISQKELDKIFDESPSIGWKNFYEKYSKSVGIIRLSQIKQNEAYALVYVDYNFGGLGGSGDLYLLELIDGSWEFYSKTNITKS